MRKDALKLDILRVCAVFFLVLFYTALSLYFHLVVHKSIVYNHFVYFPIVLSCMWWGRKGLGVAFLLALITLGFHLFGIACGSLWDDASRIVFFFAVAFCIAALSEKVMTGQQALRDSEKQLVHSIRLAEMGEMAACIAHELNQPLTGIRNFSKNAVYMLSEGMGAEEVERNLLLITQQVDRASKIINQMRELARKSDRQLERVNLNETIREIAEFLAPQFKLAGVDVKLDLADDLPCIVCDKIRIEQVFLNLMTNAKQAMEDESNRRLRVATIFDGREKQPVQVEVSDTGKGFSPEESEKLFLPFYTTKKVGQGTGLGLSVALSIVKEHKGSIDAQGSPGKGAKFTVKFPIGDAESQAG